LADGATRRGENRSRLCETGVAASTSLTRDRRSTLRYWIRSVAAAPSAATPGRSATPERTVKLDAEGT
jgi:hypothetical protein